MALTNTLAQPNKIINKIGSVNSWEPNFGPTPLAANPNIGLAPRALIIQLNGQVKARLKSIDYNVNIHSFTGSSAAQIRILGRLAILRNFNGLLNPVLFDPIFTPKSTTGNFSGVNWQDANGVTLPMFDWDIPETILTRFIGGTDGQQSKSLPFDYNLRNESDSLTIILTSFYGDTQPSNSGAVNDFTGIHSFLGSQPPTGSNAESYFVFRALSLIGDYC